MVFRTNWRRPEDWLGSGLSINTTNETSQLYDAALTQFVGWYDDPALGGLENTLNKLVTSDPGFVTGRTLALGIDLLSSSKTIRLDAALRNDLDSLLELTKSNTRINEREIKHVDALNHWANGRLEKAATIWEDILCDFPCDMQALKFAHDTYFYLGKQAQIRDSVARVYHAYSKNLPLESYIHGMFAFGLEETNYYEKAESEAKKGLQKNPNDAWATHALAHVLEMQGRTEEGIQVMSKTVDDWKVCNYLACHNFWHWALYHIEQEEYEAAVELFDTEIGRRSLESKAMLDIVDMCSLLYRLELLQPKQFVKLQNWQDAYSLAKPHLKDHILGFNDAHFLMACFGSNHIDESEELIKTLTNEVSSDEWVKVTQQLLEAMKAFKEENYSKTVDILIEIKYDLVKIGGSNAQRDVFNQLLIVAALNSPLKSHKNLCRNLLYERESFKSTPLLNKQKASI